MKLRPEVPALEPRDDAARVTHGQPVIALVAEKDRDAALEALVRGVERAGGRAATLRASLRGSPGFQLEPGVVFCHPDAATEGVTAALAALPAHDVLIADGALAMDVLRATLSITVVASESPALYSRDLRAVRHRLDLVLLEARANVLERLAERVAASAAGARDRIDLSGRQEDRKDSEAAPS